MGTKHVQKILLSNNQHIFDDNINDELHELNELSDVSQLSQTLINEMI